MMSAVCRTACLRALPLARGPLPRTANFRQMSASSVPGSSGQGMIYYLFVAAATTGGGIYLYRTLSRDKSRFQERRARLESNQPEWTPKPWPPKADGEDAETSQATEVREEVEEAFTIKSVAVNAEEVVVQNVSTVELGHLEERGPPVEIITSAADQEVTPQEEKTLLEGAAVQETVVEVSEAELSSAPVEKLGSLEEETAPAEDLSELSFRKPETDSEESPDGKQ